MLCCHITIGDCCDVAFCCSKGIHNGLESKSHCDCIRVVVIVRHCRRSNGKLFFCANISIWFDCRGKMSSNHTRYYLYSDIHDALSPVNCHNSIIQIGQQRNLNNIMRGCCVCLLCFETATAAAAASCPKIRLTPRVNAQLSRILKLSPPLLSSLLYSADQKGRRRRDPVMKYCNNSYFEGLRFNLPLSPYPQPGQSHPG